MEKGTVENDSHITELYNQICLLSEQVNTAKEKLENCSLVKISEELEELKQKTIELEQFKNNINSLSQQNGELQEKNEKETNLKLFYRISMLFGFLFLIFLAICAWFLLFPSEESSEKYLFISKLSAGILVLVIMATFLVLFTKKIKNHFVNQQ